MESRMRNDIPFFKDHEDYWVTVSNDSGWKACFRLEELYQAFKQRFMNERLENIEEGK